MIKPFSLSKDDQTQQPSSQQHQLHTHTQNDRVYAKVTAQQLFHQISNPHNNKPCKTPYNNHSTQPLPWLQLSFPKKELKYRRHKLYTKNRQTSLTIFKGSAHRSSTKHTTTVLNRQTTTLNKATRLLRDSIIALYRKPPVSTTALPQTPAKRVVRPPKKPIHHPQHNSPKLQFNNRFSYLSPKKRTTNKPQPTTPTTNSPYHTPQRLTTMTDPHRRTNPHPPRYTAAAAAHTHRHTITHHPRLTTTTTNTNINRHTITHQPRLTTTTASTNINRHTTHHHATIPSEYTKLKNTKIKPNQYEGTDLTFAFPKKHITAATTVEESHDYQYSKKEHKQTINDHQYANQTLSSTLPKQRQILPPSKTGHTLVHTVTTRLNPANYITAPATPPRIQKPAPHPQQATSNLTYPNALLPRANKQPPPRGKPHPPRPPPPSRIAPHTINTGRTPQYNTTPNALNRPTPYPTTKRRLPPFTLPTETSHTPPTFHSEPPNTLINPCPSTPPRKPTHQRHNTTHDTYIKTYSAPPHQTTTPKQITTAHDTTNTTSHTLTNTTASTAATPHNIDTLLAPTQSRPKHTITQPAPPTKYHTSIRCHFNSASPITPADAHKSTPPQKKPAPPHTEVTAIQSAAHTQHIPAHNDPQTKYTSLNNTHQTKTTAPSTNSPTDNPTNLAPPSNDMLPQSTKQQQIKEPDAPQEHKYHQRTRRKQTLLRNNTHFDIATFNARSLCAKTHPGPNRGKLQELLLHTKAKHPTLKLISIQEHKIAKPHNEATPINHTNTDMGPHNNPIYKYPMEEWTLYYTTAPQNPTTNIVTGGVGILLKNQYAKHITDITAHSARAMTIQLDTTNHFFSCYAPTALHPEEQTDFLNTMTTVIDTIPRQHKLFILGDFNAILRPGDSGPHGHVPALTDICATANHTLITFLQQNHLTAADTLRQVPNHYTFTSTLQTGNQRRVPLDHLFIRSNDTSSLHSFLATMPPTPSDHRIVIFKLRIKPRYLAKQNKSNPTIKLNYKLLLQSQKAAPNQTHIPLHKQLIDEINSNLPHNMRSRPLKIADYNTLTTIITTAANKILPPKPHTALPKVTHDVDVKTARTAFHTANAEDIASMQSAYKHLMSTRHKVRERDILHLCKQFENLADHDPQQAYHALKAVCRKNTSTETVEASSPAERLKLIANTCEAQLRNNIGDPNLQYTNRHPHLHFDTNDFTLEELQNTIQKTPNNKALGLDGINYELLKIKDIQQWMLDIINDCWRTGETPDLMRKTHFIMLPKPKQNHKLPEAWRYIALMSHVTKLYDKLIGTRIIPIIDKLLRINQNGFRPGRGTIEHCIALQAIKDYHKLKNIPLVQLFIDFKAAFPSVQWYAIEAALNAWNVPDKISKAIMSVYHNHTYHVNTTEGPTPTFTTTAGVLQGDTLAPFLFILVLDCILYEAIDKSPTTTGVILRDPTMYSNSPPQEKPLRCTDMDYADDIVLLTNTMQEMQTLLTAVTTEAARAGLMCNIKKTKYIVQGTLPPDSPTTITLPEGAIEQVNDYCYLGVNTNTDKDLNERIGRAWTKAKQYTTLWKQKDISRTTKLRLAEATVFKVLLYGASAYPYTTARNQKLQGAYTNLLKYVTNTAHDAHLSLEHIYKKLSSSKKTQTPTITYIPLPQTQAMKQFQNIFFKLFEGTAKPKNPKPIVDQIATHAIRQIGHPSIKAQKHITIQNTLKALGITFKPNGEHNTQTQPKRTEHITNHEYAQLTSALHKRQHRERTQTPKKILSAALPVLVKIQDTTLFHDIAKTKHPNWTTQKRRITDILTPHCPIFTHLINSMLPQNLIADPKRYARPCYDSDTVIPRIFFLYTELVPLGQTAFLQPTPLATASTNTDIQNAQLREGPTAPINTNLRTAARNNIKAYILYEYDTTNSKTEPPPENNPYTIHTNTYYANTTEPLFHIHKALEHLSHHIHIQQPLIHRTHTIIIYTNDMGQAKQTPPPQKCTHGPTQEINVTRTTSNNLETNKHPPLTTFIQDRIKHDVPTYVLKYPKHESNATHLSKQLFANFVQGHTKIEEATNIIKLYKLTQANI